MSIEPEPARRPTGSIPLSWAVPAEAVTAGGPPRQSSKPVIAVVFGAIAAVGSIALLGSFASSWSSSTAAASEAVTPATPPPQPPPTVDVVPVAVAPPVTPPEPPAVQPVAAAEAAAHAVTPAARARARQLTQRARVLAKAGKVVEAHGVAEQAIAADPDCGECWKTVALLRQKTGDRAGSTIAKARAATLGDDDTP